jgi:hypothetical protein
MVNSHARREYRGPVWRRTAHSRYRGRYIGQGLSVTPAGFRALVELHSRRGKIAGVTTVAPIFDYGIVKVDNSGVGDRFTEKPKGGWRGFQLPRRRLRVRITAARRAGGIRLAGAFFTGAFFAAWTGAVRHAGGFRPPRFRRVAFGAYCRSPHCRPAREGGGIRPASGGRPT